MYSLSTIVGIQGTTTYHFTTLSQLRTAALRRVEALTRSGLHSMLRVVADDYVYLWESAHGWSALGHIDALDDTDGGWCEEGPDDDADNGDDEAAAIHLQYNEGCITLAQRDEMLAAL